MLIIVQILKQSGLQTLKDVQCISCQLHGKKGHGNGRMDTVAHFSVPTLMGHGHLGMNGMERMYTFSYSSTLIRLVMETMLTGQRARFNDPSIARQCSFVLWLI